MTRRLRIHPAIGVARMGNSPEHFVGPELAGVPANWDHDASAFKPFRDSQGRILRQGARFRVYEHTFDDHGNPFARELAIGGEVVDIEWRVHIANRKASFFTFYGQLGAEDAYLSRAAKPAAEIVKDDPQRANLRNANITANRSDLLDIDPGEQTISQQLPGPVELTNTNAHIPIKSLGTLIRDGARLIVLGGYGESNSTESPACQINEYANNDTWFDDASDGSVKARVRFADGTFIDADPAWLFVGPPDFAPAAGNVVSLLDTLWDTAVREITPPPTVQTPMLTLLGEQKAAWLASGGKSLAGFQPSFLRDIYPLLKRAFGARQTHVSGTANPNYHDQLTDWASLASVTADNGTALRQYIFGYLRNPDDPSPQWDKMPRGLGDDYTALDDGHPTRDSFLTLTRIQYALLKEWAANNFIEDWPGAEPAIRPAADPTPDDLDQAGVETCVGGPFYPGIEVSWLIRRPELFSEPFRVAAERAPASEQQAPPLQLGALTLRPGFFSQQMAQPWQADFYDCHKERHEDPDGNEYYFMWWTAQRPDDVIPSGATTRARWVRPFDAHATTDDPDADDNNERFAQMQQRWHELKFVRITNGSGFEEEP